MMTNTHLKSFLNVLIWEGLQNTPVLSAYTLAIWWEEKHAWGLGILVAIAGAIGSAAMITLTEPLKLRCVKGHALPSRNQSRIAQRQEFVVNGVIFAAGGGIVLAYVGFWPHRPLVLDLGVGASLGLLAVVAQFAFASTPRSWRNRLSHGAAFGVACLAGLGWLHWLSNAAPSLPAALMSGLAITGLMTLIISSVDYSLDLREPATTLREELLRLRREMWANAPATPWALGVLGITIGLLLWLGLDRLSGVLIGVCLSPALVLVCGLSGKQTGRSSSL